MAKNLIFQKIAYKKNFGFFGENRASSLFYTWNRLTCCKKSEKSNDRKYENFCHRGRERREERREERETEAILKDQSVGPKKMSGKPKIASSHEQDHKVTYVQKWKLIKHLLVYGQVHGSGLSRGYDPHNPRSPKWWDARVDALLAPRYQEDLGDLPELTEPWGCVLWPSHGRHTPFSCTFTVCKGKPPLP